MRHNGSGAMPVSIHTLKRRFRREPLIQDLEIRELIGRGVEFQETLRKVKQKIAPADFAWYPYDSFGTLSLLDGLLTGRARFPRSLIGTEPVLDVGCGDGDLAFFFESLGHKVYAIDNPPTNYNGMRGVHAVKGALRSSVRIESADLDSRFRLPVRRCGLALFFGILYHLKNPFGALEALAARARYCLLSTAVTRFTPDQTIDIGGIPVACLAGRDGLRGDETNYWIFSEAGLRVLLDRTGWEVCDWMLTGDPDSILWGAQRDERVFCLLRSRAFEPLRRSQLLGGWHTLENGSWRWTARRFSVAVVPGSGTLILRCTAPDFLTARLGVITLTAYYGGAAIATHVFRRPGDYDCAQNIESRSEEAIVEFELDKALAPDTQDGRERGVIVRAVETC